MQNAVATSNSPLHTDYDFASTKGGVDMNKKTHLRKLLTAALALNILFFNHALVVRLLLP